MEHVKLLRRSAGSAQSPRKPEHIRRKRRSERVTKSAAAIQKQRGPNLILQGGGYRKERGRLVHCLDANVHETIRQNAVLQFCAHTCSLWSNTSTLCNINSGRCVWHVFILLGRWWCLIWPRRSSPSPPPAPFRLRWGG